jgi:hypothetical protein
MKTNSKLALALTILAITLTPAFSIKLKHGQKPHNIHKAISQNHQQQKMAKDISSKITTHIPKKIKHELISLLKNITHPYKTHKSIRKRAYLYQPKQYLLPLILENKLQYVLDKTNDTLMVFEIPSKQA